MPVATSAMKSGAVKSGSRSEKKGACIRCGKAIAEPSVRAGYVHKVAAGMICPFCSARDSARARQQAASAPWLELRRSAWKITSLTSALLAVFFLRSASFFYVGIGMFFLLVTTCVLFLKLIDTETH